MISAFLLRITRGHQQSALIVPLKLTDLSLGRWCLNRALTVRLTSEILLLKLVIAGVGRRMLVLRIGIATVRVDARRRLSARMVHVERRR